MRCQTSPIRNDISKFQLIQISTHTQNDNVRLAPGMEEISYKILLLFSIHFLLAYIL